MSIPAAGAVLFGTSLAILVGPTMGFLGALGGFAGGCGILYGLWGKEG